MTIDALIIEASFDYRGSISSCIKSNAHARANNRQHSVSSCTPSFLGRVLFPLFDPLLFRCCTNRTSAINNSYNYNQSFTALRCGTEATQHCGHLCGVLEKGSFPWAPHLPHPPLAPPDTACNQPASGCLSLHRLTVICASLHCGCGISN